MYGLAKKQSKIKEKQQYSRSQESSHVPTQLVNLLEEALHREEEYVKIIHNLKQQKQTQAKEYMKKLEEFSKYLEQFKRKKEEEEERKDFRSFQMKRQEEVMKRNRRTVGKKEFVMQDIESFSLEIELKFMFFNPILEDPLSSYYPKKLDIRFNSLGLEFMSGKIGYEQSEEDHREILNENYPLILKSSGGLTKNNCFNFSLTPSKKCNINKLSQLMRLIKTQLLQIQIYDYDSQILFGVSYVNLDQLLFYDKAEDYWVEESIVFSSLRSRDVGKIDIQFRNYRAPIGDTAVNLMNSTGQSFNFSTTFNNKSSTKESFQASKLKVTSNAPLDVQSPEYDIRSVQQKERRLLRRINQHKQQNIKLGNSICMNFNFNYMKNQIDKRKLQHIMKVKQENKYNFSEQILSRIHQEFQSYECSIGNPLIIPFVFTNSFDEKMNFQVVPSELVKQMKHVSILTDMGDYEFYKRDKKIVGQPVVFYPQSLKFSLAPSQSIFILVKYLTFAHVQERPVEIQIINSFNSDSLHTYVFKIKSIPELIDHRFRIFQGEGKLTELFIPYNQEGWGEESIPHLYCKQALIQYAWGNNGFSLRVPINKNQDILVFLFDSKNLRKLLKCYQIVIKKFMVVQFNNYELGLEKTVQLEIPSSETQNQVVFFSSDSQKLWTQMSNNKVLKIKPNSIETISVTARTLYYCDQNIILSCNKVSGEIHCQWLFKLKVSKPVFKNTHVVIASTSKKTGFTLEVQNPSNRSEALGIVSNNLKYLQVEEGKKVVNGGKMVFVDLIINPHAEREGEVQVIVNVSNFDQTINMNYLIKITYSKQYKQKQQSVQEIVYRRY